LAHAACRPASVKGGENASSSDAKGRVAFSSQHYSSQNYHRFEKESGNAANVYAKKKDDEVFVSQ